jgi:hypothetical protein
MKNYEVTFEWPNGDWTWIYVEGEDFHKAMLLALASCPRDCRVHHLQFMTAEQVAANKAHDGARWTSVGKLQLSRVQSPSRQDANVGHAGD